MGLSCVQKMSDNFAANRNIARRTFFRGNTKYHFHRDTHNLLWEWAQFYTTHLSTSIRTHLLNHSYHKNLPHTFLDMTDTPFHRITINGLVSCERLPFWRWQYLCCKDRTRERLRQKRSPFLEFPFQDDCIHNWKHGMRLNSKQKEEKQGQDFECRPHYGLIPSLPSFLLLLCVPPFVVPIAGIGISLKEYQELDTATLLLPTSFIPFLNLFQSTNCISHRPSLLLIKIISSRGILQTCSSSVLKLFV